MALLYFSYSSSEDSPLGHLTEGFFPLDLAQQMRFTHDSSLSHFQRNLVGVWRVWGLKVIRLRKYFLGRNVPGYETISEEKMSKIFTVPSFASKKSHLFRGKKREKRKNANVIPLGPFSFSSSPFRIEPSLVKVTELPFQVMSVPWFK